MNADHQRYDELAVGWALHALEPEDEAAFGRHLPGCDRCAETIAEATEVMGAMAADLPAAEPSEGLGTRLRAAVDATEQVHRPVVPPVAADPVPAAVPIPSPRRPGVRMLALVAAAVAAVLGLGVWSLSLNSERRDLQATVAEQGDVLEALLSPDGVALDPLGEDGRSVATVVPRGDEVEVLTHGVPVNEAATTTYVLWGVGDDGAKPLGTFDVDRSQIELRTVGSGLTGLDDFAQYAISLEPGQEAPSAPTEVVATGQVTS
jgi:anti-sigma-K factor RskA